MGAEAANGTWLITGGAGFIGSNFVRLAARRASAKLVVLDLLTYAGTLATISSLVDSGAVTFARGDIRDTDLLERLFAEHDFQRVIHFAAESHVDRSIAGPDAFMQTNVDGTYRLLEAARGAWRDSPATRLFVQVSTDEVYGSLGPDDAPFNETSPYRPNSPYSASKAAADHLARAWFHTYGLPVVITNCANNYGPWQFPEKLIPLMILNAVEGRELPVYGDGAHVRDWLHVADHCDALLAVTADGKAGECYVIGGENEQRNIDTVTAICRAVDVNLGRSPGTSEQLIRHVPDRPGHDRRYAIDPAKIRNQLGWRPTRTFENSLEDVVQWYLDSANWVADIRAREQARR